MTSPPRTDSTDTLAARKEVLRRQALARRDAFALDKARAHAAAQAIAERGVALLEKVPGGVVAGYWPIRSEVDPRPLLDALAARGFTLALPAVTPNGLVFRRYLPVQQLAPAGFGTLGPDPSQAEVAPTIVLAPLAAFDRARNRIGYGRGHYDGAIARLRTKRPVAAIGIAYAVQEIDAVPHETHDQPLDAVLTESQLIGGPAHWL